MADLRRLIDIYLDVENSARRKFENGAFFDPPTLNLFRGTQNLFRCRLMLSDAATKFTPDTGSTFLFGIDNTFTLDHADLVVSLNDQFNIVGDWSGMNPADGEICWRADLTSAALKSAIGSEKLLPMWGALWMCPPGGHYTLLGQWELLVWNIAVDPTTASPQDGITFITSDIYEKDIAQLKAPTNGWHRSKNGLLQIKNSTTGKFQTISLSGEEGHEKMDYGPQED